MTSVVVLGSGVNGLVAACRLAVAGHTVTVMDSATAIGGASRTEEFAPGYFAPPILDRTERFSPTIVSQLQLTDLKRCAPLQVVAVNSDGDSWTYPDGAGADTGDLASGDAAGYRRYEALHQRLRSVIRPLMESAVPSPVGAHGLEIGWLWSLARGYKRLTGVEREILLRVPPAPLGDWLTEQFQTPAFRASLAWAGLQGAFAAPASPGTAAIRLFHDASDYGPLIGGIRGLLTSLESACRRLGVVFRLGHDARIVIDQGAVSAVECNGERTPVRHVLSTLDPVTTLLERTQGAELSPSIERALRNVRSRGTTVRFDFALEQEFRLTGGMRASRFRFAGALQDVERAFDAAKYHRVPERPWLEVRVPLADTGAADYAPSGRDIVSVLVRYVSGASVSDASKSAELRRIVVSRLDSVCPGFSESILAERYHDHAALQREYGLYQGNVSHVEPALDQMLSLRPIADCGRYQTPLTGLWLGGMGSHPGGGVTGLPGWLGAGAILAKS